MLDVAKEYLEPLQAAAVDTLVLGCTHYPLLAGPISYVMGRNVALVSSSEETAKDVYRELAARNLLHTDTQAAVGSSDDDGAAGTGVAGGVAGSAAFGADGAARAAWGEVPTLPRVVLRRTTPGRTPASWAPSSL